MTRPFLAALLLASVAGAQPAVTVDASTIVQSYATGPDRSVSEVAVPILVVAEVMEGVSLSARAVYATVEGDGLASLSGLGDTQLGASYRRALGTALLDVSLLASLPTGQTALAVDEFATAAALALDDFAFALPSLGQGTTVAPAVTVAVPSGENMAFGVGAAYATHGGYTLFAADSASYAPADELILSTGVDIGLGGASSMALEGSYVLYGDDAYAGQTFSPGDKIAGTMRLTLDGGAARARLLARYRHVFDGVVPASGRPVAYRRPQQAQLALALGFGPRTAEVAVTGGARYYGTISTPETGLELASFLAEQQVLLDIGGTAAVEVSPGVTLRAGGTYTQGLLEAVGGQTLTGFRFSGGLRVAL
ncbi:hypothetical protein [Rubrivirga sp. IMCC45206]|uniref:hypothetical protein n=1 Tax=Rubrivirga sp. IMCC45206 TaxID=3391614 RepID=UPI00398FB7B2